MEGDCCKLSVITISFCYKLFFYKILFDSSLFQFKYSSTSKNNIIGETLCGKNMRNYMKNYMKNI